MSGDPYNPDYEYLAYIDESGETGLKTVLGVDATGSSEWFVLSLVLVPKELEPALHSWITEMLSLTGSKQLKDIHFSKLSEPHRRAVTQLLSQKGVMCFAICSNKKNMKRYRNPRAEVMGVNDWFYCWVTRLALERASHFVWRRSIQNHGAPKRMKIIFSERGGLKIGQIGAYYEWIKKQSLNDNLYLAWGDIEWETVHPLLIDKDFHKNLPGLKLADIVAAAFYAAADNKQSGPCEPQHAKALKSVMARFRSNETGRYSGYGVKLMPSWGKAKLSADQKRIFEFYGYPLQLWQQGRKWELPPPRK